MTQLQAKVPAAVRRGRPRNSSSEATRERLMRAAAQHFSSAEFSEVAMEKIAATADLTPAAIYNHFSSKEQLFIATATQMMRRNLTAITAAIDAAEASNAGWKGMLTGVLELIATDETGWMRYPLLVSAVQLKMLRSRGRFAEILELRRGYVRQFERIVVAAIGEGGLPAALPRSIGAQLLLSFVFNGLAAVMNHRQSEADIRVIVDSTALLLGAAGR
ncbi:MAG: TetR/AcrR family transcriptional regulator [Sandaracinobacteroides sp.]